MNLRTASYPIALLAPNAKRIKAVIRHLPTVAGTQQAPVAIGGSGASTIEELNLSGSVESSTGGLIPRNNTAVTVRNLVLSGDGIAGYRQTPLAAAANILAARVPIPPFVMGEAWAKADAASLGNVKSSGAAWTVWSGTPGITARQAAPATAANTKAVAAAASDGYTEIVINSLSSATGEGWMIFRGIDTNNYWRLGFTTGAPRTLVLQKVVAGAVTGLGSFASTLWTSGIRLGILHSGSTIKVYADGRPDRRRLGRLQPDRHTGRLARIEHPREIRPDLLPLIGGGDVIVKGSRPTSREPSLCFQESCGL